MAHAKLSPSSAERWINCPPSVKLSERFPNTTSPYAEEGSCAHRVAEIILQRDLGMLPRDEAGTLLEEAEMSLYYTKDMPDNLLPYTDYVSSHAVGADFIGLEERLNVSDWVPEGYGTGDAVIIKDGVLEVIDLKYGQGVPVSATNNPQFRLYGLGAIYEWYALYPFDAVRCTVIQPRLDSISSEDLSVAGLLAWAENVVKPAALLAAEGKGEYCSGDHCRWCKAKAVCRKRAEDNMALARYEFAEPALLTNEGIADILPSADNLEKWIKDINAYALDQALNQGVNYHGYKVVEGRSNRKIVKEDEAVQILTDNGVVEDSLYIRKLIGIPGMEKAVGKRRLTELLKDHIVKEPGAPALVRETDKRPAIRSNEAAAAAFKE